MGSVRLCPCKENVESDEAESDQSGPSTVSLKLLKQFEVTLEVCSVVQSVAASLTRNVHNHSSFASKLAALRTLCDTGCLVVDCGEEFVNAFKEPYDVVELSMTMSS